MAVGSGELPELFAVAGFRLGVTSAGIKILGRKDLVVLALDAGSEVAALFTQNVFCAAPVTVAKKHLVEAREKDLDIRYLVVNTGNANAGTGATGLADAESVCRELADLGGVQPCQVLPFSTGVIGEPFPVKTICGALPAALQALHADAWLAAAEGILTTDTRPKAASRQITVGGKTVTISGIAKGAGMIKPNMATMLAFIATDAIIGSAELATVFADAVDRSFNRITVDGDTSTNDSAVLIATGASGAALVEPQEQTLFASAVGSICLELAHAIVRDGEGATRFVAVEVGGGAAAAECLAVAYTIAESPLVKTALFAADPNWGRILAAVGRSGIGGLVVDDVNIWLDDVLIVDNGGRADTYEEVQGQRVMNKEAYSIRVELGRGACRETVWTTDLSHEYIRINAEYRS